MSDEIGGRRTPASMHMPNFGEGMLSRFARVWGILKMRLKPQDNFYLAFLLITCIRSLLVFASKSLVANAPA